MKVSIIMPVYNVKDYVDESIQSVLNQTFTDFELLIIDDGSTDGSSTIVDNWASKDSRIKVIHQKNQGQSAARNTALKVFKGDYLTFLDSDDAISQNYLERLVNAKESSNADAVVTSYKTFTTVIPTHTRTGKTEIFSGKNFVRNTIGPRVLGSYAWGKLFNRSDFANYEFPVGLIYEDMLVIPYVMYKMKKVIYLNEDLYFYRQRPNSSMTTYSPARGYEIYAIDKLVQFARKEHDRLLCWLASINEIRSWIEIKHRFKKHGYDFSKIKDERKCNVIRCIRFVFFPFF